MIRSIALLYQKTGSGSVGNQPIQSNLLDSSRYRLTNHKSLDSRRLHMDMNEVTLKLNSRIFRLNYALLENAIIAFFYEERFRLGTLAIAMPGAGEIAAGRSSVLVGGKYIMTTRALAEKLAAKSGKISLVSLFTELGEAEALRLYVRLLEKITLDSKVTEEPIQPTPSV